MVAIPMAATAAFAQKSTKTPWMMVLGPDTPSTGEVSTKTQIWHDQFAQTLANLLGYQYISQQHSVGNAVKSVFN